MGIGATILAFTNGRMRGQLQAEQIKQQRQEQALRTLAELAQIPGFSIGDSGTPTSAAPVPAAAAPGSAAAPDPLPPILRGARSALAPSTPAPSAAPSPAPTAGGPIKIGALSLGGGNQSIMYDPSLSPAALERARQQRNQAAYQHLEQLAPGTQGDFDPTYDYAAAERSHLKHSQMKAALIKSGYSDSDADLLANYNVDAENRAEKKAQLDAQRAEIADAQARTALDQEKVHAGDLEDEATGLIESGVPSGVLGATLKALHPKLSASAVTRAVGGALASKALREATIGQRNRSGQPKKPGGLKIMGMEIDPSMLGDSTGGALPKMDAADSVRAASDPAFAAWLKAHGATP